MIPIQVRSCHAKFDLLQKIIYLTPHKQFLFWCNNSLDPPNLGGMWLFRLKRHPFPVLAFFRNSLVLTYAFPSAILRPLLPPGVTLDTYGDWGFVAIALVQTEKLRPAGFPSFLGQDFFLSGYRIFSRYRTSTGRNLRGLKILRSDTDKKRMAFFGNLLTHYHYQLAQVKISEDQGRWELQVKTRNAKANLHLIADLKKEAEALPPGSPFRSFHEARLFAGPLPFTFDHEPETSSIVLIEGVRQNWKPRPVTVQVLQNTFFQNPPFEGVTPVLANAFHISNISYKWKRGVVDPIPITT